MMLPDPRDATIATLTRNLDAARELLRKSFRDVCVGCRNDAAIDPIQQGGPYHIVGDDSWCRGNPSIVYHEDRKWIRCEVPSSLRDALRTLDAEEAGRG